MKPLDEQIRHIMSNFDFKRTHRTMVAIAWKWAEKGNPQILRVPSVLRLKEAALELLQATFDGHELSCGGFRVENKDGLLRLSFVVAEWEGE